MAKVSVPKLPGETGFAYLKRLSVEMLDVTDCVVCTFSTPPSGYPKLKVGPKWPSAHRVMCELVNGPPPSARHQAAHSCGLRVCVTPQHLRWATPSENCMDKKLHGTSVAHRGEDSPHSKLKEDDVLDIRRRLGDGAVQAKLAREYGVTPSLISRIATGSIWTHLLDGRQVNQ